MGEIILEVGGGEHVFGPSTPLDEAALEGVVGRVKAACPSWNATATELRRYVDSGEGGAQRHRADVLVRMRPGTRQPLEVRHLQHLRHVNMSY
jgi:hypothetical protein